MESSLWQLLKDYRIEIPILQRDYAQGRQIGKVPSIRKRFLASISESLKLKKPLKLDFVYGYTRDFQDASQRKIKSFVPLDGQQRLTTLFLWHWYIAVKENKLTEAQELLGKFTYETRHSSRVFCTELVKYNPIDFSGLISETIIDQPWFFAAWKNDPTISSMLVVLDDIQEAVTKEKLQNIWPTLISDNPHIVFQILKMEELGLPDDLYIKMNSRGKELTDFEHFKSRFSEVLDKDSIGLFVRNIDQKWSDLFWNLCKDEGAGDIAKSVDDSFLRFFKYISDMLIYFKGINIQIDYFDITTYFPIYKEKENTTFLFSSLEVLYDLYNKNSLFFNSVFYVKESDFSVEKVRLFFNSAEPDLFKKCAGSYNQYTNSFSIGEQLLLFASLFHLIYETDEFPKRIRTIRNLIANSGDTVRKENMASLLNTVKDIVYANAPDPDARFNTLQINEEQHKQIFLLNKANENFRESLYKLEDHHLLQGCTAAFWDNSTFHDLTDSFYKLFTYDCNYEEIDKALLTIGDYTQKFNKWYTQVGKNQSMWRELLTPSNKKDGFDKTKVILHKTLGISGFNPTHAIADYLNVHSANQNSEKDWRFYFLKYPDFWHSKHGFYYWIEKKGQYECMMMNATTLGGYRWCPYLTVINNNSDGNLSLEGDGKPLTYVKNSSILKITTVATGYKIEASNSDGEILLEEIRKKSYVDIDYICKVDQTKDGIDIEDRIEKGLALIANINTI